MKFKQRSLLNELLDNDGIPTADLYLNLKELNTINTLLGGYAISYSALRKVLSSKASKVLVDIGCGGGDTLKNIEKWGVKNNYTLQLHGIDLKQDCITYCTQNNYTNTINFICDDYRNAHMHLPNIDIIHACLFCHHLTNHQLIELIQYAQRHNATLIINDLERNPIAYYAIKVLTTLFSKSYLVRNDAPLSVARGFKKHEWLQLITTAGARNYSVKWQWAFRHQLIIYPNA